MSVNQKDLIAEWRNLNGLTLTYEEIKAELDAGNCVYRFCSYWGTWNRVLYVGEDERLGLDIIELDMTPVNSHRPNSWNRTKLEVLRSHCTDITKDRYCIDCLPQAAIDGMKHNLGVELADKIAEHDYMDELNVEEIRKANWASNGGGIPLQFILDFRSDDSIRWTWKDGVVNYSDGLCS